MEELKYPRKWRHKKTKKTYRVMPWWEIPETVLNVSEWAELTQMKNVKAKFGVLVQIGYLLENESGVWFGFNLPVKKAFKDLGEYVKEETKK